MDTSWRGCTGVEPHGNGRQVSPFALHNASSKHLTFCAVANRAEREYLTHHNNGGNYWWKHYTSLGASIAILTILNCLCEVLLLLSHSIKYQAMPFFLDGVPLPAVDYQVVAAVKPTILSSLAARCEVMRSSILTLTEHCHIPGT